MYISPLLFIKVSWFGSKKHLYLLVARTVWAILEFLQVLCVPKRKRNYDNKGHFCRDTRRHTGVKTIFHSSRLLHLTQDPCKEGMWKSFFSMFYTFNFLCSGAEAEWKLLLFGEISAVNIQCVCNSKSLLVRHLLCDVIEMEDLTPAGETSSVYPSQLYVLLLHSQLASAPRCSPLDTHNGQRERHICMLSSCSLDNIKLSWG